MRLGVLQVDDLMTEDDLVLAKLDAAGSPVIARKLDTIRHFQAESLDGYSPRIIPKQRWLDPLVLTHHRVERLSVLERRQDSRAEAGDTSGKAPNHHKPNN
jgi:hypothetical protein